MDDPTIEKVRFRPASYFSILLGFWNLVTVPGALPSMRWRNLRNVPHKVLPSVFKPC
jgi:hypothetical protein